MTVWAAISLSEALPGQPLGETREAGHVAESADRVPRCFELEEERGTGSAVERVAIRWTPEVDLFPVRLPRQEVEPVGVRDGDPALHRGR